jgi:hypothetical protein
MVCGHVYADDRILYWWGRTTFPRLTTLHEYVSDTIHFSLHYLILLVVWPTNLVYCALFNTLHSQEVLSSSRFHFIWISHQKPFSMSVWVLMAVSQEKDSLCMYLLVAHCGVSSIPLYSLTACII